MRDNHVTLLIVLILRFASSETTPGRRVCDHYVTKPSTWKFEVDSSKVIFKQIKLNDGDPTYTSAYTSDSSMLTGSRQFVSFDTDYSDDDLIVGRFRVCVLAEQGYEVSMELTTPAVNSSYGGQSGFPRTRDGSGRCNWPLIDVWKVTDEFDNSNHSDTKLSRNTRHLRDPGDKGDATRRPTSSSLSKRYGQCGRNRKKRRKLRREKNVQLNPRKTAPKSERDIINKRKQGRKGTDTEGRTSDRVKGTSAKRRNTRDGSNRKRRRRIRSVPRPQIQRLLQICGTDVLWTDVPLSSNSTDLNSTNVPGSEDARKSWAEGSKIVVDTSHNKLILDVRWTNLTRARLAFVETLEFAVKFMPLEASPNITETASTPAPTPADDWKYPRDVDTSEIVSDEQSSSSKDTALVIAVSACLIIITFGAAIACFLCLHRCRKCRRRQPENGDTSTDLYHQQRSPDAIREMAQEQTRDRDRKPKSSCCPKHDPRRPEAMLTHHNNNHAGRPGQYDSQPTRHRGHGKATFCCCGNEPTSGHVTSASSSTLVASTSASSSSPSQGAGPNGSSAFAKYNRFLKNPRLYDGTISQFAIDMPPSVRRLPRSAKHAPSNRVNHSNCIRRAPNLTLLSNDGRTIEALARGEHVVRDADGGRHLVDRTGDFVPGSENTGRRSPCQRADRPGYPADGPGLDFETRHHNQYPPFESAALLPYSGRTFDPTSDRSRADDPPPEYSEPPGYDMVV